ncbi:hypothetical protein ACFOG5_16255 [Pedobacter fastidiosus]|uniref:Uncharacterized protein n=1 Tax=Pedobacter fastidiosus TaxID=2765361 RepID=A0ABR7KPW4_9SPHI|nr:hypothetical protein [Pedobacter fastidiosus]MBC6110129.1 hypothetical protein [Pedobacter fastidiosus]
MKTLLKIGKWYWITIFMAVAVLEITQGFERNSLIRWVYHSHIPLLLFIVLLIFHRNWLSWLFMVFVCMYGLFDLFAYAPQASSPTKMDFGLGVSLIFIASPLSTLVRLSVNPLFFYFFTLIIFLTRPVRHKYFKSNASLKILNT